MVVNYTLLSVARVRRLLAAARKARVLVVGDVMLDQFIWGGVSRISPEAPVPVVEFQRESFWPRSMSPQKSWARLAGTITAAV